MKAREDIDTLREQYDNSVREYDKLNEENRRLQVMNKLHLFSESQSRFHFRLKSLLHQRIMNHLKINEQTELIFMDIQPPFFLSCLFKHFAPFILVAFIVIFILAFFSLLKTHTYPRK